MTIYEGSPSRWEQSHAATQHLALAELQQLHDALARREAQLRATLYSIGDAVIVVDPAQRVTMLNPVAEQLTGWPEPEAIGQPLDDIFRLIDEQTRHRIESPVSAVLRDGAIVGLGNDALLVARDGQERAIADCGAPIRDADGRIVGVVLVFRDRTQEREAQRRVVEAQVFAESILATLREPLLVLDENLHVVAANRSFYQTFHTTPTDTIGHPIYELGDRQWDIPALRHLLEAILPHNSAFDDFEVEHEFPSIGRRTMLLNARRVQGDQLQANLILLAMEDVTERKRAHESRARLAAIIEGSDDAILSQTLDGRILTWNAGAERLYGYSAHEVVGEPITLIIPPERHAEYAIIEQQIQHGERVGQLETEHLRKDGSRVQVSLTVSPIRDEAGRIIGASMIARDITERRQTEEDLRRASEHLAQVGAASPAVLYTLKVEANSLVPTWVSANVTTVMGYSVSEALQPDWWVRHVHHDDRAAALARMAELLTGDRLVHDYRFLHKDGSVVWIRDELRVVRDAGGRVQQIVGARMDVTERRALEEQFLQIQKMESVGRLAGGVAHDFNNLITVIAGIADLALGDLREGDPLYADLLEIRRAAERAAALTRQLLAFGRRQIVQPQVLNLNATLADMEQMLRRVLGESIDLLLVPGAELGNIRVDPTQLEQVILNLVINSRDAMPRGGRLTIETANVDLDEAYARQHLGVTPGPYVMLAVTDTGIGMDEATHRRVFEPFFTTKPPGTGSGLGLSTVYGIVKQSGGNIWVYSEPNKGTTFKVYLPRVAAPAWEGQAAPPVGVQHGTETILLVEDEPALRQLTRRMLEAAGYTVLVAASPGEASLIMEYYDGPVHLLLTDVVMPHMSGPELATHLARSRQGLKVLYMSGYAENAIVHQGALEPGVPYLGKPFDFAALTRKVREVLDAGSHDLPL